MKAFSPAAALVLTLGALHAEPVVLENQWIKAVVDPGAGGRVVQLLHKPTGRQFTEALTLNDAPGGSGLFNDRFWKRRQTRDLETSPYEATRVEPAVRVDMVRAHRGRGTDAFLVKKSFRLPRERASLIAEYQMENLGASDWEGRVWISGLVRPSSAVDELITFHFPTGRFASQEYGAGGELGRWTATYRADPSFAKPFWIKDPTSGWAAATDPSGVGLAAIVDRSYLGMIYSYLPSQGFHGRSLATLEFMYGPVCLRPSADDRAREGLGIPPLVDVPDPGKPWQTRLELLPSADLGEAIVGAADGLVIGVVLGDSRAVLAVTSATARALHADVAVRPLAGTPFSLGKLAVTLEPGVPKRAQFAFPTPITGSAVLTVALPTADGTTHHMCLPVFKRPEDAIGYEETPYPPKKTDFTPKVRLPELDPDPAETPHVKWLRPLRRKPRVLVIATTRAIRSFYEVRQRFDAEFDVALVAMPHGFTYRGATGDSNPNYVLPHLLAKEHDLLVIPGGIVWAIFPESIRRQIIDKVRGGTGLLYINPYVGAYDCKKLKDLRLEELTGLPRVPDAAITLARGVQRTGIPVFERFGSLADSVHTAQLGAGRVALYKVPIWPHGKPYLVRSEYVPFTPNDERDAVDFRFSEYHYLFALRLMAWAARADPPLLLELRTDASPARGLVTQVRAENTSPKTLNGILTVHWRNRCGETVAQSTKPVTLAPGVNRVDIGDPTLRGRLVPGYVITEVFVRTENGEVLGSAADVSRCRSEVSLSGLTPAKVTHEPGAPVHATAYVAGTLGEDARLLIRSYDAHRRLVGVAEVPVPAGTDTPDIGVVAPSAGQVANGGFEQASEKWPQGPAAWRYAAPTARTLRLADAPRPLSAGERCLRVETGDHAVDVGLYSQLMPVDARKPLRVGGWIKGSGDMPGTGGAYLGVGWYDGDRRGIRMDPDRAPNYTYIKTQYKDNVWREFARVYKPAPPGREAPYKHAEIPPNAAFCDVRIHLLRYPRPVLFDDIVATQDLLTLERPDQPRGRKFPVTLTSLPGRSVLHRLEAELRTRSGRLLDVASCELTVRPALPNDIRFQVWGPRYETLTESGQVELDILKAVGFDYAMVWASSAPPQEVRRAALGLMRGGLQPVTQSLLRVAVHRGLKSPERDPCLVDPAYQRETRERLHAYAGALQDLCFAAYFNADENSLGRYTQPHDFCQAPASLARFRSFLKGKYGTLARLNDEWRTAFSGWDAVKPFTHAEAKAAANWTPWIEHRTYMADEFCSTFGFQRACLRERDAHARFAVSGMGWANEYNGFDWYLLMQHLDHMAAYAGQDYRTELMRSFKRPDAILGAWTGYGRNTVEVRHAFWWQVLTGFFCPAFYSSELLYTNGLRMSEAGHGLARVIAELKGGIGKMLMAGERLAQPIAVHHSYASMVALTCMPGATGGGKVGTYFSALNGWCSVLHQLGYQFTMVDRRQLKRGDVGADRFRVLVMSLACALDDAEIAAAREFVSAGGTLIVDPAFALAHENGRPASRAERASWLGLEQASASSPLDWDTAAPQVTPYRKGQVVLVTHAFRDYATAQTSPTTGHELRDVVRTSLIAAAVAAPVTVTADKAIGDALWAGEVVRYDIGNGEVLGFYRSPRIKGLPTEAVTVRWPTPAHVYDVCSRTYLGHRSQWHGNVGPTDIVALALLPYRVRKLTAVCAADQPRQGESIAVDAALDAGDAEPARHAVHVTVTGPDGAVRRHYSDNALLENGRCRVEIPLALNDPPGTWQAVLRDAVSGTEAEVTWHVVTP